MSSFRKFRRLLEAARLVRKEHVPEENCTIEFYSDGSKVERFYDSGAFIYSDKNNEFHREDGPAVFSVNGNRKSETWYRHGLEHRTDGPFYINYHEKVVMYAVNDKRMTRREYLKHFEDNTEFRNWDDIGLEIEPAP